MKVLWAFNYGKHLALFNDVNISLMLLNDLSQVNTQIQNVIEYYSVIYVLNTVTH